MKKQHFRKCTHKNPKGIPWTIIVVSHIIQLSVKQLCRNVRLKCKNVETVDIHICII